MNLRLSSISNVTFIFLAITGGATLWGRALTLSFFVGEAHVSFLAYVLILDGIALIVIANVYEYLVQRIERSILLWLMGILIAVLVWGGGAAVTHHLRIALGVFFIAQRIFTHVFYNHAFEYVTQFYASQHDREGYLEAMFSGRAIQGLMCIALIPMSFFLAPRHLITAWALSILLSALLVIWMSERLRIANRTSEKDLVHFGEEDKRLKTEGSVVALVRGNLIRWLTIMAFAVSVLSNVLLYGTLEIAEARFVDFNGALAFFSLTGGLGVWLLIPLKFYLLSRLLKQYNAGRLTELYPATLNVAMVGILLVPSLLTAAFGEITRNALRLSFYEPIERLLHFALPGGMEGWAKRFIDHYVQPLGHIGAAAVVIGASLTHDRLYHVGAVVFGVLVVIAAQRSGKYYGQTLAASLTAGQYRVLRQAAGEWGASDTTRMEPVIQQLVETPLDDRKSLMLAEVIAESHLDSAYLKLCQRLELSPPDIQTELLPIIIHGWSHDKKRLDQNRLLVEIATHSTHHNLRRAALEMIACYPQLDPHFRVAQLLLDEDPSVNIVAASVLMHHPSPPIQQAARSQLRWLSQHRSTEVRVMAVRTLVQSSIDVYGEALFPLDISPYLEDPATRVREACLGGASLPELVRMACDPSGNVRRAAIRYLRERRFEGSRKHILNAMNDLEKLNTASPYIQIENMVRSWRLLIALASVTRHGGKARTSTVLTLGFAQLDLLDSMIYTLKQQQLPALKSTISQLSLDYQTIVQCMLEFVETLGTKGQVSAIFWTLEKNDDPAERQTALHALSQLIKAQYASEFERVFKRVPGASERLESGLPKVVLKALLAQYDDWRPLITMYAVINMPQDKRQWLDAVDAEAMLKDRLASHIPAIREASRFILAHLNVEENSVHHLPLNHEIRAEDQEIVMLSILERMIFLRNVSFFGDLRIDQLRALARVCDEVAMPAGKTIIHQGDYGDGLYVVVEGSVAVMRNMSGSKPVYLFSLGVSEVFGEISLLDGGVRTADVIAETAVLLLGIKRSALDDALEDDPSIAMGMLRAMADRIRRSTESFERHLTTALSEEIEDPLEEA